MALLSPPTAAKLAPSMLLRLIAELEWALLLDTGANEKRARPIIMYCFANFMFLLIPQIIVLLSLPIGLSTLTSLNAF